MGFPANNNNDLSDSSEEDSTAEQDPDEAAEEDFAFVLDSHEAEHHEFNATDFATARGMEQDSNKHKAKWEQCQEEKDALIKEGRSVTCKPPKKQKMDIGERVQEKSGQKRAGIVFKDDHEGDSGAWLWSIQFEDGVDESAPLGRLKLVWDDRMLTWQTLRESAPENPIVEPQQAGAAGFRFEDQFGAWD